MPHESDGLGMLAPALPYFSSSPHAGSYSEPTQHGFHQQQPTYPQQPEGLADNQLNNSPQQYSYSTNAATPQPACVSRQADGHIRVNVSQLLSAACVQQPAAGAQKDSSAVGKATSWPEWCNLSPAGTVSPVTQQTHMVSCTARAEHASSGVSHLRTMPKQPLAEQQAAHKSLPEANSRDCSHDDAVVEHDSYDDVSLWLPKADAQQVPEEDLEVHTKHAPAALPD